MWMMNPYKKVFKSFEVLFWELFFQQIANAFIIRIRGFLCLNREGKHSFPWHSRTPSSTSKSFSAFFPIPMRFAFQSSQNSPANRASIPALPLSSTAFG